MVYRLVSTTERGGAAISFNAVTSRYGRVVAVDDVSLSIAPGEKLAIIGSNGSGKSTLARCVLGLQRTHTGTVAVDGTVARTRADWQVRRRAVAYIPQKPAVGRFPLLVHELLASSGHEPAATSVAERLGVVHLANRPVHTLSGGQLQRCVIARGIGALAAGATVLVADEPTSALDFDGQDEVAELLATIDATLLVVTHERTVVDRCDRTVAMAGGRLREPTR